MKRKVIQIAGSTQLVSLPRQWAKAHNVQRGAEVDVQEDGNHIIVSVDAEPQHEAATLDISGLGSMIPRTVSALYKRGIDSLTLRYSDPSLVRVVNEALTKDTVGFEILEQSGNSCVVKHVAGAPGEFDSVLRRIFLLLNTTSDECLAVFKKENYSSLGNLAYLEEANNRFTTSCMRYINKIGRVEGFPKVGPLYFIVEQLEQLADQYKYLCQHFANLDGGKTRLKKEVVTLFERASELVRVYSETFYKFESEKLVFIKEERNSIVEESHGLLKKPSLSYADFWLIHHSITIAQMIFGMTDSLLVLRV